MLNVAFDLLLSECRYAECRTLSVIAPKFCGCRYLTQPSILQLLIQNKGNCIRATTLSITKLNITTFSIISWFETLIINDTLHKSFKYHNAECCYAECRIFIAMLCVVLLSVVKLNATMLSVVMLSDMAPLYQIHH